MTADRTNQSRGTFGDWLLSRAGIATLAILTVAAILIYTDHTAHFFGAIGYLLLLACPLMHIFGHRSHHHGAKHQQEKESG
jgi:hypothetical protein